jgi:hypothetical protein
MDGHAGKTGAVISRGRDGKMQIGAYFEKVAVFTIQEVLARESRERGIRVTMQDAITEAMQEWCSKRGVTLPKAEQEKSPG